MSANNSVELSVSDKRKKPPRKVHPMPKALLGIGEKDSKGFFLSMECDTNAKSETYGLEFLVAQTFTSTNDKGEQETIDLKELSLDHLRSVCRSLGVSQVSNLNKFTSRKQIAVWCQYQSTLKKSGLAASTYADRLTSNICRLVNVCFSEEFFDDFKKVHDRKTRGDHEMNLTAKAFWIKATEAYNSCCSDDDDDSTFVEQFPPPIDDFAILVFPPDDTHLNDLMNNPDVNLKNVDSFTSEAFRKKINNLFKVRRTMQKNMHQSGTHDNEAWNFVETAMKELPGLTKIACYYFYMRCEMKPEIDGVFQPFLDTTIKGSSEDLGDDYSSMGDSAKKRKKEVVLDDLFGLQSKFMEETKEHNKNLMMETKSHNKLLMEKMEEQNQEKKRSNILKEEQCVEVKRMNNFMQRLEVAKAMNDKEALSKLWEEANK
jgi:hypothetical protein